VYRVPGIYIAPIRELRLLEDDGTATIREHTIFEVPADRPYQNAPLYLAPDPHQVVHGVAVGNVSDVLVDYGPASSSSVT
jgi:hypothetical protein